MSDHKFVRNRKTGVIFGRNASIERHPDIEPYFPPAEPAVVEAPPPAAHAAALKPAISRKSKNPAASPTTGAAAAADAANAEASVVGEGAIAAALALDPEQFTLTGDEPAPLQE